MPEFIEQNFEIATQASKRTVSGVVCAPFAYRREADDDGLLIANTFYYQITHLPSGCSLLAATTEQGARAITERLLNAPVNWSKSAYSPDELREIIGALNQLLSEMRSSGWIYEDEATAYLDAYAREEHL